jgi:hypothetical protein
LLAGKHFLALPYLGHEGLFCAVVA